MEKPGWLSPNMAGFLAEMAVPFIEIEKGKDNNYGWRKTYAEEIERMVAAAVDAGRTSS